VHLPDGILSPEVLLTGAVLSCGGVAVGLARLRPDDMPRVGVLSSAFFVISLIHVPVGPVSVHLTLSGLMGIILGAAAFPAIGVALAMQAAFFGHGGITALGANTFCFATPAIVLAWAFRPLLVGGSRRVALAAGIAQGTLATVGAILLVALALVASGSALWGAALKMLIAHLPVMAAEGIVTGSCVLFLRRVRPDLLQALRPSAEHWSRSTVRV
jgi:cobalt/nickel transport system permease protein